MGYKSRLFYLTAAVINLMAMVTQIINIEYWAFLSAFLSILMFNFALCEGDENENK